MPCSELSLVLKKEFAERLQALGVSMSEDCLLVSVDQQKLWHFYGSGCDSYTISTARAGRGCVLDSHQTPTGLHQVSEKFGADAPAGTVFKARQPTGKVWSDWPSAEDNLITSRILWLAGLEPGHNAGANAAGQVVDTQQRYVYIHGTNQHAKLGTPNSHGCVLLSDADVIALFDRVPVGTQVYIR
jgi:lipoprotein-anchoring transpeptidase ErfK/SrfK